MQRLEWESTKPRSGTRARTTLGSRDAGSRLGLVFELSQFLAQARRFGAILCRLDMVLGGGDASDRIKNLGDGTTFAFADMFDLVGKVVLVLRVSRLVVSLQRPADWRINIAMLSQGRLYFGRLADCTSQ